MKFFILTLNLLLSVASLKFNIKKDLRNKSLDSSKWPNVEVQGNCEPGTFMIVDVTVPSTIKSNYSGISVFFANDDKNILRIDFEEKVKGTFYKTPYQIERKMESIENVEKSKDESIKVSGIFESSWLPQNCSKISAAVTGDDTIYNFYGIKNYEISIKDLLVVEEYNDFICPFEKNVLKE